MPSRSLTSRPAHLLSQQVTGSRYFFLNLSSRPKGAGCQLALGGREHCNPDYVIDRDTYAYHVLEYVAEGRGELKFGTKKHSLVAGSVFAYAPTTRCEIRSMRDQPMVKYFICLAGAGVNAALKEARLASGELRQLSVHGEIRSLFEDLINDGQHAGPRLAEVCATRFRLLMLKLAEAVQTGAHASEVARENFLRCRALIDAQVDRLATLQDIAAAVNMDVSSICRLFRRYQGISPYQYLLRRKMNLAAEFLVETDGLVKEAALRVGFADPYHFSRCFKAIHGVAPRHLRRNR